MNIILLDGLTLGNDLDLSPLMSLGNLIQHSTTAPSQVGERIKDATCIITNKVVISKEHMLLAPSLKLICVAATGTNNIDLMAAKELGIEVKNVRGYSTEGVAQHTLACILYGAQHLHYYHRYATEEYANAPIFSHHGKTIYELKDKTLGIIGLGAIGQRVAQLAEAFGMKVQYHSASGQNLDQAYPHVDKETLFSSSDILSIHAPLNPSTQNFVDTNALSLLKPSAFLINTGRGGIVDEQALAAALSENRLAFAALDVFDHEPIRSNNPLLSISSDKLLLTPHIAWASMESRRRLLQGIVENIKQFIV